MFLFLHKVIAGLKGFNVDGCISTPSEESPQCHNSYVRLELFLSLIILAIVNS